MRCFMNIILMDKVHNLGQLGDKISVKAGYARNFLIPQGKAVLASEKNIANFEVRRAELEKKSQELLDAAMHRAQSLQDLVVVISSKAGDEGRLYGSIGTRDIAKAVSDAGVALAKHEVRLPYGPLRQIGEYDITVQLHGDVSATVKVQVVVE